MTAAPAETAARLRFGPLVSAHVRRDWVTAWSYRLPFIAGLFSSLFGLITYFFIARLVDRSEFEETPELANGYFAFVMLGSSLVAIMTVGLTANASRLQRAQSTGTLEAMAAAPAPLWLTTFLGSMYELLYATASAFVTVALGVAFFGVRFNVGPLGALVVAGGIVATFLLFASLGMAVAAFGLVYKRTGPLIALMTTALSLLGGVFFPVDLLPGPVEFFAKIMPFTWAVDVIRLTLLAGQVPVLRFVALAATAALAFPLSAVLFDRALVQTRRSGTLSHY